MARTPGDGATRRRARARNAGRARLSGCSGTCRAWSRWWSVPQRSKSWHASTRRKGPSRLRPGGPRMEGPEARPSRAYDEAERELRAAIAHAEASFGTSSLETAAALNALGWSKGQAGASTKASSCTSGRSRSWSGQSEKSIPTSRRSTTGPGGSRCARTGAAEPYAPRSSALVGTGERGTPLVKTRKAQTRDWPRPPEVKEQRCRRETAALPAPWRGDSVLLQCGCNGRKRGSARGGARPPRA